MLYVIRSEFSNKHANWMKAKAVEKLIGKQVIISIVESEDGG
jgi:hypothetical protein